MAEKNSELGSIRALTRLLRGGAPTAPQATQPLRLYGERPNPQGSELRRQYPEVYGALAGVMGSAPDELGGSVLDPLTARVRAGAERGFPVGTALNMLPFAGGVAKRAASLPPGPLAGSLNAQMGAIKPKGGNFLSSNSPGSVERTLKALKRDEGFHPNFEQSIVTLPDGRRLNEITGEVLPPLNAVTPTSALNNWVDKQLTRYVKNEMATPEDPLRALADKGISHLPAERLQLEGDWVPDSLGMKRHLAGYPAEGLATTPAGRGWETMTDTALESAPASAYTRPLTESERRRGMGSLVETNPWLSKLDPETKVYNTTNELDLGFTHLMDELRNATNPASGLPPELLLKYSSLPQVSLPQAVERVSKINAWRAAQKAEADLARANNAATALHKEYPDKGYKWVELRAPENTNPAYLGGGKYEDPNATSLADALKYEGETMGHCVGGYCPDVLEGRSRIFSLRDAKGEPHVTIEVKPPTNQESVFLGDPRLRGNFSAEEMQLMEQVYGDITQMPEELASRVQKLIGADVPKIVQIKGKANRAPKDEYLPFVQDFVKSGKWSDVGDLGNSGLRRVTDAFNENELKKIQSAGIEVPTWATPDEIKTIGDSVWPGQYGTPPGGIPEGFAQGGLVSNHFDPIKIKQIIASLDDDYDPQRIQQIIAHHESSYA